MQLATASAANPCIMHGVCPPPDVIPLVQPHRLDGLRCVCERTARRGLHEDLCVLSHVCCPTGGADLCRSTTNMIISTTNTATTPPMRRPCFSRSGILGAITRQGPGESQNLVGLFAGLASFRKDLCPNPQGGQNSSLPMPQIRTLPGHVYRPSFIAYARY